MVVACNDVVDMRPARSVEKEKDDQTEGNSSAVPEYPAKSSIIVLSQGTIYCRVVFSGLSHKKNLLSWCVL